VAAGERLTALARESGDVVAFLIGVHLTLWTHTSLCVFGPAIALMDQVDAMGLAASRGVREFRTIAVVYGPVPTAEGAELVRQWLQEPSLKPHLQQTMRQCLLALLALAGRFDEVEADLPTEDPVVAATSGLALRHYYVARGEIGKAAAAISRAVSWLDGVVGSEGFASTLLGLEALCRLELGQLAAAEAALAQAERWTAAEDIASVITNTVCRAELAAQDGRREDALRLSARAIEIMDRTDELFEIGEWRRALAAAHERLGDVDGAARRLREARGAFARKGVVPMVRRVDGELARLSRAAPDR
jgi:tetratricopeptide (TPR) repeat protein